MDLDLFIQNDDTTQPSRKETLVPFFSGPYHIGWIKRDYLIPLKHCASSVTEFRVQDDKVELSPPVQSVSSRTQAIQKILQSLRDRQLITERTRPEAVPVFSHFGGETLFFIEREVMPFFGLIHYSIFINAYTEKLDSTYFWLSRKIKMGKINTSKLNGFASCEFIKPHQTLRQQMDDLVLKQAGMSKRLSAQAKLGSEVSFLCTHQLGLYPKVIFTYDLEMPCDYYPFPKEKTTQAKSIESFLLIKKDDLFNILNVTDRVSYETKHVLSDVLKRLSLPRAKVNPRHHDFRLLSKMGAT